MLTDVIGAIATPPGRSAVALIRLSGDGAHSVASAVLTSFRIEPLRAARLSPAVHPGSGELLDEALYVSYRRPASYTGEDMVEISTHGGMLVPAEVLGALLGAGARQAEPGEFTRRALANGKIDLLQAEAIGDLVAATAPAQRRAAIGQLDRGLSRRISTLRTDVLELEALCCYEIDFPEEDGGPVDPGRIEEAIADVRQSLSSLLATAVEGERLQDGAICVIAGRPNAGKSSLFNALLGRERAIVTEIPGTTRDAIEAHATCDGFPFRLIDTAGLRKSDDEVERIGVEVSHRYLAAADVILLCIDAAEGMSDEDERFVSDASAPVIVVSTKADLAANAQLQGMPVSALNGSGLDRLRQQLAELAFSTLGSRGDVEPVVTRERHRVALELARDELTAFAAARTDGLDGVVAATHLRAAVNALDDIIGVVSGEEVLDRVFATFCVGK